MAERLYEVLYKEHQLNEESKEMKEKFGWSLETVIPLMNKMILKK